MTEGALLIFAKAPVMGAAKTRLAADIGPVEAGRLNRFCHARAMRAAQGAPCRVRLCVSPDRARATGFGGLWPLAFARRPQGGGDLGARLARAFAAAPPGPVVVIGTDAPDVSRALVRRAFLALRGADAVVGPAHDGGFWLFGASRPLRRRALSFSPVRWSTRHAARDLEASLPAGARIARLPALVDLDDGASLAMWRSMGKHGRS